MRLHEGDPVVAPLRAAIRKGDVEGLKLLLGEHPGLAAAQIGSPDRGFSTPLLMAADWPGFFPNGARVVALLIGAGADPNASTEGHRPETPLHYAASSDDADVARALIDGGADVNAPDGSIGTPLSNAVGYGCWQVADLLVARGAKVEALWEAAALGLMDRIEAFFAAEPGPDSTEINNAFWQACNGGQPRAAAYLLARGADIHWVPDYAKQKGMAAAGGTKTRWDTLVSWLREQGAKEG